MEIEKFKFTFYVVGIVSFFYILGMIYSFYSTKKDVINYPPWVSPCPDYWANTGNGKCEKVASNGNNICKNINGVSPMLQYPDISGKSEVDFTKVSNVDKCKWANACNVYWEGISDKPCVESSFSK
jgi:hypothetical protein